MLSQFVFILKIKIKRAFTHLSGLLFLENILNSVLNACFVSKTQAANNGTA